MMAGDFGRSGKPATALPRLYYIRQFYLPSGISRL